jgi:peptidyl-prolyl cis-trans isomerase SurA
MFLFSRRTKDSKSSVKKFIDNSYNLFVANKILDYEETVLENKYPEYKNLVNEYRDGILLFEVTDKMVWSKAAKDEDGLRDFYNRNKSNYGQQSFDEAKKLVTADYQTLLDEKWIKELRSKYTIDVNKEILKTLK